MRTIAVVATLAVIGGVGSGTAVGFSAATDACPTDGDLGWFEVRAVGGDLEGDGRADRVVTATRDGAAAESQGLYELCVELSSGAVERTSFRGDVSSGGVRPLGSVDLGGDGETLLVANSGGASTTLVSAFELVSGALVGISTGACEDEFCGGWLFGVGGGVQHGAGATCVASPSGGYRLVTRHSQARHPLPEHYEDTIFDRHELSLRRVGDRFASVGEQVDWVSYGQWVEPWRWWSLGDCPGISGIGEDGLPLQPGYCSGYSPNPAPSPAPDAAAGYLVLEASGRLHSYSVPHLGDLTSVPGLDFAGRAVAVAAMRSGDRYWIASSAGRVHAFGIGDHFGHLLGISLNAPVVDMVAHPTGDGYWLVAADGGVFAFGAARYFGSMGALPLNAPIVGMASTPAGDGYWLVAADGGVFAFGAARYFGSMGAVTLNSPVVAMASAPAGDGYWLIAADGGVFSFNALFHGSVLGLRLCRAPAALDVAVSLTGGGYYLLMNDAGIYSFGDAYFRGADPRSVNEPVDLAVHG